jgi:hypothetical protein
MGPLQWILGRFLVCFLRSTVDWTILRSFVNKLQTRLLYFRPPLIVHRVVVSFTFEKFENGASGFHKQAANTTLIC